MRARVTSKRHLEATFHDPEEMHRAVLALVKSGVVRSQRIRVGRRMVTPDGRSIEAAATPIRGLFAGGILGATLAVALVLLWWSFVVPEGRPTVVWLVWRLVVVGLSGALGGALIGTAISSMAGPRRRARSAILTDDYLVRVDAPDEVTAAKVRDAFARAGADLVTA
jgi:hypothetical protein